MSEGGGGRFIYHEKETAYQLSLCPLSQMLQGSLILNRKESCLSKENQRNRTNTSYWRGLPIETQKAADFWGEPPNVLLLWKL